MSGLFGSVNIKGNRLTEFAAQTSTVGIPIPFGFGRFPVEGNVIFAPMPPKEHVKKKKQGKGGVKTTEYSYSLSYAIAFCQGPIYGFLTIKRNGKVVWTQDPNASVDDKLYAAKWKQKATFYLGTKTQLPDSTIQAYKGVGRVSAFRNLAYIVVEDDDVTDNGGAVPTYEAVVIASPPDVYLTSKPYVYVERTALDFTLGAPKGYHMSFPVDELTVNSFEFSEGRQREVTQILPIAESINNFDFNFFDGQHKEVLVVYRHPDPNEVQIGGTFNFPDGTQQVVLITYGNFRTDEIAVTTLSFPDGSIT